MALGLLNPIKEQRKMSMNKLRLQISFNVESEMAQIFKFYAR